MNTVQQHTAWNRMGKRFIITENALIHLNYVILWYLQVQFETVASTMFSFSYL